MRPLDQEGPQLRGIDVITGPDGCFHTDEAAAGEVAITASVGTGDLAPNGVLVRTSAQPTHVALRLLAGAVVEGSVTEGGRPCLDVNLVLFASSELQPENYVLSSLTGRSCQTDSVGRFRFSGVLPGLVAVSAMRNWSVEVGSARWTLAPGQKQTWNVEVADTGALTVRVVPPLAPTGKTWKVALRDKDSFLSSTREADAEGVAPFSGLPAGPHTIRVSFVNGFGDHLTVAETDHDGPTSELTVTVPPECCRLQALRGRLVDADQRSAAGRVVAVRHADSQRLMGSRTTDADGVFTFDELTLGRHGLVLLDGDFVETPLREFTLAADRAEDLGTVALPTSK